MPGEIFQAGVRPGGPSTFSELKILIVHSLSVADATPPGEPVPFDVLHEALREHELVNYFDLVEAVDHLAGLGYIEASNTQSGGQAFALTKPGKELAAELASSLSPALRSRAASSIEQAQKRRRRLSEVKIAEERKGSGYILELSIPDFSGELLSIRLFAPSIEDRDRIKRRFLNDPIYIYKNILALLTGEAGDINGLTANAGLF